MMNDRDDATFLRAALLLGLISGQDVVRWADERIHHDVSPAPAIYDLALTPAADLSAVRIALQPLADEAESPVIVGRLLAVVHRDLATGRRSVADTVRVFAQMRGLIVLPDSVRAELDVFEDTHMLAVSGVEGEVAAVERNVREWLTQFAAPARA